MLHTFSLVIQKYRGSITSPRQEKRSALNVRKGGSTEKVLAEVSRSRHWRSITYYMSCKHELLICHCHNKYIQLYLSVLQKVLQHILYIFIFVSVLINGCGFWE